MALTNYWWLLIWLLFAGGFLGTFIAKQPVEVSGKIEYRWSWGTVFLVSCPYVIWAAFRRYFGDTEMYRKTFLEVPASFSQLSEYLTNHTKDKGFSVLMSLLKMIIGNNDVIFFLIIAAFQLFCVVYFFRKYSSSFLLCMFMFIASTDYLSWMFNGMRQFLAVCIILLSFGLVLQKKYVPAIAVILLASTIHGSALIMIPIIFMIQGKAWNKKTMLMLLGVVLAILFIGEFTSILDDMLADTQYSDMITNEIWTNDDGTNIFRVMFYSIPAVLSLVGKRCVDEADSPVINLCVNCAVCTAALYLLSAFSSGIYIGRLPIYTTLQGYAAVPWLIDHMFTRESAKFVKIVFVGVFLMFFYYQMHMTWGVL